MARLEKEPFLNVQDKKRKLEELAKLVFSDSVSVSSLDDDNDQEANVLELKQEDSFDKSNTCAWHDSDDEKTEYCVNLDDKLKLKKLKKESHDNEEITAAALQKRLKKFRTNRNCKDNWLARLRNNHAQEETSNATFNTKTVWEKPTFASRFNTSAIPILGKTGYQILREGKLQHYLLPDLNRQEYSNSSVTSCGFLDDKNLFFAASQDQTIRLFQTQTVENQKHCTYHIKNREVKDAFYLPKSSSPSLLFLAGYRSIGLIDIETEKTSMLRSISGYKKDQIFFHISPGKSKVFSVTSNNGHVLCCDIRIQGVTFDFKMNAEGHALTYIAENDETLCSGDNEGFIYIWDIRAGKCRKTFHDEGSLGVTSLGASFSSHKTYLATGSTTGYVNLYTSENEHLVANPLKENTNTNFFSNDFWNFPEKVTNKLFAIDFRLIKTFSHLTTPVTSIAFHPSENILAISSKFTREGLKFIHLPSCNVFSNFPRQSKHLYIKYPECLSFNRNGSSVAIGNNCGVVKHIQLLHYSRHLKKSN